MKRCPECRRDYYDDTLSFCLADGAELVYGVTDDEPATAILSGPGGVATGFNDSRTLAQIHTTERSDVLPSGIAEAPNRGLNRWLVMAPVLVAIIILGSFIGYRYVGSSTSEIDSIAVLPFENRSGSADSEYLSDAFAESLIYRLSQLPGLKVSPTNAVLRYKASQADIGTIARELDVDAVMSGRLTHRGDDMTISVELT